MKVGSNFSDKDKLRHYLEDIKVEVRVVIRVGMVDGPYTIFSHVKSAVEPLDVELWRSRRKANTAGSSTTWKATNITTEEPSSRAANHKKTGLCGTGERHMKLVQTVKRRDVQVSLREIMFWCW
jgi:hypothetical protein